ncbi:DUF881 domain-containing protein [Jeotgalibacillus proteolyticus]|uniref:DUF881 domain-containing protein n=1 Tax=Jeotgalibacillus proteolyticus TaxID=2082395 RepID=UPI001FD6AF4F|nr:DUF881 domain-containing protein [Jeotgalibacillus proteolyticus]
MKQKGRTLLFSIVFLVLGFLLSFSYSITKEQFSNDDQGGQSINRFNSKKENARQELLQTQQENLDLQEELFQLLDSVREYERTISDNDDASGLAVEADQYRLILGKVAVEGPGVAITLADGEYDPAIENINDYLVHEHHLFHVINELYIAGAEGIAINGQRIARDTYIICNGPVITVDNIQLPAPFTITAIGDYEVMSSALTITGGVRDQLVNDSINFTMEKKELIRMAPVIRDL